jgi:phospholipid/cholesterol/gamma-HCH transport system substrate-binding protein
MNFERWGETIIGAVVAGVAVVFLVFAVAQAGQGAPAGGYELFARFQRVDGIAVGSEVRISGVKVGVVRSVSLDPDTFEARLTFALDRGVQVLDDSTARVASDGLLGGAYIAIEPAGLEPLAANAEIPNTQGAVDLLTLFASFAQSGGGPDQGGAEATGP